MRAGDGPERFSFGETGECHELRDINLVGASRFCIGDVGEPFQFGRHVREIAVLFRRQRPFAIDTN